MKLLPPVWLKGVKRIMLLKLKHQKLVQFQLETVEAIFKGEGRQKSLLLLTKGLFVQI